MIGFGSAEGGTGWITRALTPDRGCCKYQGSNQPAQTYNDCGIHAAQSFKRIYLKCLGLDARGSDSTSSWLQWGIAFPPLKLISKTWLVPSRPRGYPAKAEAIVALNQGLSATWLPL